MLLYGRIAEQRSYCDELKAAGSCQNNTGKNRISDRCLFFCHQTEMDIGQCRQVQEKKQKTVNWHLAQ